MYAHFSLAPTFFFTFSARFVREIHSTTGPTGQRHELLMEMCTFQDGETDQRKGSACTCSLSAGCVASLGARYLTTV